MMLYEEAVALENTAGDPKPDTLLTGALLLLLLGRMEDSRRWVEQALKLAPDSRDAHFEKARLLLRRGESSAAAAEGETALRLKNGSTRDNQIHYLLVQGHRDGGFPEKAALHVSAASQ